MQNKKTHFVILGLLSIKPMSGYDMKKVISSSIGYFWSESNGQLYPTLRELVEDGLISLMKTVPSKKPRDTYSITSKGACVLKQWLEESTKVKNTHRDEELLKLFFGKNSSPQLSLDILRRREQRVREELEEFLTIQKGMESLKGASDYPFWKITLRNGILSAEAELRWCQESITELSSHGVMVHI